MPKSILDWNIEDPCPSISVADITPVSKKAFCLMLRNRDKDILHTGFINIAGAIEMMKGLDYHFNKFLEIMSALSQGAMVDSNDLDHEAVAYINRIGQFHAFAESSFVKRYLQDPLKFISTLQELIVFRHKHTAHRSIDKPRGDTDDLQWVHARSLTPLGGRLFILKSGCPKESWQQSKWKNTYISYQIYDITNNKYVDLVIERDHQTIIAETYSLIEELIMNTQQPNKSLRQST